MIGRTNTQTGVATVSLENDLLKVVAAPEVGGRIVSIYNKETGYEFLWKNAALPLVRNEPGAPYDPNFYGGIDELLPNDLPEVITGIEVPDHGELWTMPLDYNVEDREIVMSCTLPRTGISYNRRMKLSVGKPEIITSYRLINPGSSSIPFLWKLHAALSIAEGDRILCDCKNAFPLDLEWSRCTREGSFDWPCFDNLDMSIIPPLNDTNEFLCLTGLKTGCIAWERPSDRLRFTYTFDKNLFRQCWLFASFGKFDGHYTAILEPCTSRLLSVSKASEQDACTVLGPGETLETTVVTYAGRSDGRS